MLRVLRGLQTTHGKRVRHRELKPANLMVEERDGTETIRILDFGIATAVPSQPAEKKCKFVGNPHDMTPEQSIGEFALRLRSIRPWCQVAYSMQSDDREGAGAKTLGAKAD